MNQPATQRPSRLIALTGGIASGKTAVSDHLARLGARIVDTDLIARQVVEPGSDGLCDLVEAFGNDIIDSNGALDRKALRQRVFADPAERRRLDALLHPRIEKATREQIQDGRDAPYVVVVVPLLIESGLFTDADRVVVVDVPRELQISRLIERDGIDASLRNGVLTVRLPKSETSHSEKRTIEVKADA